MSGNSLIITSFYAVPAQHWQQRRDGTVSLPFVAGDNRKVAVKIVDDPGIESLKIVDLD